MLEIEYMASEEDFYILLGNAARSISFVASLLILGIALIGEMPLEITKIINNF
jgi:hypothetical protein